MSVNNQLVLIAGLRIDEPLTGGSIRERFARGDYATRALPDRLGLVEDVFNEMGIGGRVYPSELDDIGDGHDLILGACAATLPFEPVDVAAARDFSMEHVTKAIEEAREILAALKVDEPPKLYLRQYVC